MNKLDEVAQRIITNEKWWGHSAKLIWFEVFPHFYFKKDKIDVHIVQK